MRQAAQEVPGIQPHLIFRIPLAGGAVVDSISERLREVGLIPVSIEPDRAVIAFKNDVDLAEFRTAIQHYMRGPRIDPKTGEHYKSTKWDLFEYIDPDGLKLWAKEDRIGSRLRELIGASAQTIVANERYILDVELWHRGTRDLALASLQELRDLLLALGVANDKVLDHFVGDHLCLARLSASGATLSRVLGLDAVAEVELPPIPSLNAASVRQLTARDFPSTTSPEPDGPTLCIVDSGVASGHPLIARNVADTAVVMTSTTTTGDEHGHGTMVGGLAVFGSVRACFANGVFSSPVRLLSVRVLDQHNRFDDERLVINQIEAAIMRFYGEPHRCRVFNLSVGSPSPAFVDGIERQTVWAESLDIIARKRKVLLVVSAGNFNEIFGLGSDAAEKILKEYPAYLLAQAARLNDPATSSIAVTVGSLAENEITALRQGIGANDIIKPIAKVNHPSPFTRLGHGVNGAIKPEFVEYGGNAVFTGTGSVRKIVHEPGTAVMSFSNQPLKQLFAFDVGTSLAAPLVARTAAITWHRTAQMLGRQPGQNLIRSILASAATVPEEVAALFNNKGDAFRAAGYGRIDPECAFSSFDRRVTLVAEGSVAIDKFSVYAVPITDDFLGANGKKFIRVALAFDPPVRRRRMDYLGVDMNFQMIRGKSLPQVIAAFESVGPDEDAESAIPYPYNIPFEPKGRSTKEGHRRNASTLQMGEFQFQRDASKYGKTYWLIVRSQRKWAPVEIDKQDYAVAVVLRAEAADLYNSVSLRLQQRTRVRARV
jgi:subtilisin family serine protease